MDDPVGKSRVAITPMECVLYHFLNSARQDIGQRFKYPATGTFVIAFRQERKRERERERTLQKLLPMLSAKRSSWTVKQLSRTAYTLYVYICYI